jgi:hypothetical protein
MAAQKALTSLFRSLGQSLDKAGRCLEANPHIERRKFCVNSRLTFILFVFLLQTSVQPATQRVAFRGKRPELKCSFVASSATVVGDVKIGEHSSVWYQAVVRGNPEILLCDVINS